ncbi:FtsB family cell division protein [Siminovitchia sp. 179-K 8D1 HS]|uniref:FtsB family cell division protein n=1 Tax=Siminovitchia sp. 179-K 8D1 HS TaxID=3142385 RepID=UPI0039A3844B
MGIKQRQGITSLENSYTKQQEVAVRAAARRKKLTFRRLTAFFVTAIAVSALLISTLVSREASLKAKKMEKVQMEEKLAKLEKEQLMLENEIVKLNDDEYIAKLARSEYFLSDKGEIIFNIPNSEKKEKEKKSSY